MNETICWLCGTIFQYDNPKFRDVRCIYCGVENSIYNSADYKPMENEEVNMIDYRDEKYQGKFIYMPKVGETLEIEIKELREVKSDNPKFNFSENVPVLINGEPAIDDEGEAITKKKDLGYHIEAEIEGGKILSITSISAFFQVFKKHNINDGEKIRIFHKDKGIWVVEKL